MELVYLSRLKNFATHRGQGKWFMDRARIKAILSGVLFLSLL
jgi:hypothetical protein